MSRRHWPLLGLLVAACTAKPPPIDPSLEGDGHYLAATSAYLKGDFEAAHREFDEVTRVNPTDKRLPAAKGELFAIEGKAPEAIAAFEEASRLDPKRATTWSRLAALYALTNHGAQAREAVNTALALNPHDFDALDVGGSMAFKSGDLEQAVKDWELASAFAPESARVALVQKAVDALMKSKRSAEVLVLLQRAKARGLVTSELESQLGDRLVEAGRLDDAITEFTAAAKLNPKDPTLWELVGELEAKQGRADLAVAAFHESLKVKERGVVHVSLARLCQAAKDAACVARELDAAIRTASGEETRETLDLAALLSSVGRKRDALVLLCGLSEESDQASNLALHLNVAQLAQSLKDTPRLKAACGRAMAAGALRCP